MPRTKLNKNGLMKRNRRNSFEEKKEELIREYEIEAESMITGLQSKHTNALDQISDAIAKLRRKIPANVLSMKWRDFEIANLDENYNLPNNAVADTTLANLNATSKKMASRADEGYLTEETSLTSMRSSGSRKETRSRSRARSRSRSNTRQSNNQSVLGSLTAAKPKRSLSAGGRFNNTPGPRTFMSASKNKTPLVKTNSDISTMGTTHTSRSKYRTPLKNRPKAASADRINVITPKVQPNTPLAILRHARAGETVFSLKGSPVVSTNFAESTANVNIPVANGILSIRPAEMTSIDPSIINKLDNNTLNHLRQLKSNLDLIMKNAVAHGRFAHK